MRQFFAVFAVVLGLTALSGCGPDPLIGTYTYTGMQTFTLTQPLPYSHTDNVMGTLTIAAGAGADYSLDFVASTGSDHCVFNALRNGSGLTIPANQPCVFTVNGGTVTATITSGSGVVNGNTIMFAVQYNLSGNSGAAAIVGSGNQVINATHNATH